MFWKLHIAGGILFPQPDIEPRPANSVKEVWSPNH